MDPTNIQDDLMHELICGNTKFYEAENDGTQFLNLHYHGDEGRAWCSGRAYRL